MECLFFLKFHKQNTFNLRWKYGNDILCEDEVNLLGITFDFKLTLIAISLMYVKRHLLKKRIGNNISQFGILTIY